MPGSTIATEQVDINIDFLVITKIKRHFFLVDKYTETKSKLSYRVCV